MKTYKDYKTIWERCAEVERMDNEARSMNDEELIMRWLMVGCPDESTNYDYLEFAEDEEEFDRLVKLFERLIALDK